MQLRTRQRQTSRDVTNWQLEVLGTTTLRRRAAAIPATTQQLQEAESNRCPRTAYQKLIMEAREQQRCPCILSTDFAKAFDMLQHDYIFRVHDRLFGTPGSAELREELSKLSVAATRRRASAAGASRPHSSISLCKVGRYTVLLSTECLKVQRHANFACR